MSLNESQAKFVDKMLLSITRVIKACAEQGGKAALILGRKKVGKHTIKVSVVAEREQSFKAPLQNYSEKEPSDSVLKASVADDKNTGDTVHRNHRRTSRWQKPVF
jgi:hypothetical protein